MEDQSPHSSPTNLANISSWDRALAAERVGRYVFAWQKALKEISPRAFQPEADIQKAQTAVLAGNPEATLRVASQVLAIKPKYTTAQQVFTVSESTLNANREKRTKAKPIVWPRLRDSIRKHRLSVCMIVKNQERISSHCLTSVKDIAIDTGSTDPTIEIVTETAAQFGHFEWSKDFTAYRTASVASVNGDWMTLLKSDEDMSPAKNTRSVAQ
jgi:hypothetical protein